MRCLLDTHVFLWLHTTPERIRARARAELMSPETDLILSAVSAWELAFKQALGKLALPDSARRWLPIALDELRCTTLGLTFEHAMEAALLPAHHADPFDRFIIAQAHVEGLTLVTADRAFASYDVEILRP